MKCARHPQVQGFTLIELLVAIALGLVIFLVASNLLVSSSRSAGDLQGRNELLEESQIAQNYMAAQIREAVYVFPVGTTITLGGGKTTVRPVSGIWKVGQDVAPIVAFVRPPQLLPGTTTGTSCAEDQRRCYKFIAYYPMLRETWAEKALSFNNPGVDDSNRDRWVLVEYRNNYTSAPALATLTVSSYSAASGGEGRLLLDYVQPQSLALPGTPPLFQVTTPPQAEILSGAKPEAPGNTSVTINLALSRQNGGRVVTVPGRNAATTGPQSVTPVAVSPRNVGNLAP